MTDKNQFTTLLRLTRSSTIFSLNELNIPQRQAAQAVEGPVLILAGAGSGKTRTITYRVAHMVHTLGIPTENILGVSFTNKAAREMRERVISLLGSHRSRGLTLSTFHSLGVKILKQDIDKLGFKKNFSIYDTSDQQGLVREALKHFSGEKKFDRKEILSKISQLKNAGVSCEDFANSPFFDDESAYDHATDHVYRYYTEKLHFYNAIDFDDILHLSAKLFKKHPEVAQKYSKQFQYIMVDEYQDTNSTQFDLILALTSTHKNLCVVGDDDQSIYAFRGADVKNILNFEKHFAGAKVIKLEENYRSITTILDLANHVIKENKNRRAKTLWSQKKSQDLPYLWAMGDSDHEAQVIADEIAKSQTEKTRLSDIAILYRGKTQAPPLEDQLRLAQIPYRVLGGQKFYDKKEVKDLMAYLALILNPYDEISLRRILNVPHRGIGTATLQKYLSQSALTRKSLFQTMELSPELDPKRAGNIRTFIALVNEFRGHFSTLSLAEAIRKLVAAIDYNEFIKDSYKDAPKQAHARQQDVAMFINSAERFENYKKENATLKSFVEDLLLRDSQDETDEDENKGPKNEVTMMTLHSSKGLEFKQVYLVGVEEETLPHKKSIQLGEDIGEERRLCYVGITRAQEKLIMTYCKERTIHGKKVPRHKSRFLSGAGASHLYKEQDRTTFGHLTKEEAEQYKKSFFQNLIGSI